MMKNNKAGKERESSREQTRGERGARMMKQENENEKEMKTHNHRV